MYSLYKKRDLEIISQIFFALVWGFMFIIIFYKGKSLLPCIFAHGMIDAFSKFSRNNQTFEGIYVIATIFVAVFYCPYLLKLKDKKDFESYKNGML